MRDRLIEIIKNFSYKNHLECATEQLADYLLENGVLCPPCKIGDDLYWFDGFDTISKDEKAIIGITYIKGKWIVIDKDGSCDEVGTQYALLSEEEAKRFLETQERKGGVQE